jgi:hypothetical protein
MGAAVEIRGERARVRAAKIPEMPHFRGMP